MITRFRNMTIKGKLIFIPMITTLTALIVACSAFVMYDWYSFQKDVIRDLSIHAEMTAMNSSAALIFNDQNAARETLTSLKYQENIVRGFIYDKDGNVFASYQQDAYKEEEAPTPVLYPGGKIINDRLVVSKEIVIDNQNKGMIYLELSLDILHKRFRWYLIAITFVLLASLPVAFFISLKLQKVFAEPISLLAGTAKDVSKNKDFSIRVKKVSDDEFGVLTDGFNEMLAEIQQRDNQLEKYAEELEKEVKHRTQELTVTNEKLTTELIEREKIEQQLIKTRDEAVKATKLKDKFVSLVSHDLRSPFHSILGMLTLLQKSASKKLDDHQLTILANIEQSCNGMVYMIDQLLDISMLQRGIIKPKPLFLDAFIITLKAITNLRVMTDEKGITITNNIPERSRVYADPDLIAQVFHNVLSNAIKFSTEGNNITLSLTNSNPTTISIGDEGVGISEKILPDLFLHEKKTSTPGTKGERGTGLGLPLCNDIMKAHNGKISVDSKSGAGSTFYLELPEIKPLVMVVDDEGIYRMELINILKEVDADAIEAVDGISAMSSIRVKKPDILFTDIQMPNMDGFALIKTLRNNPETNTIPIIALSGQVGANIREKAIKAGANGFISKPVIPQDIIPCFKKYLF